MWKPSASIATLHARSRIAATIRRFFDARGVLEVETPIASGSAPVERHIDSVATSDGRWLSTSPEFAMKRLLAAGCGPVFQLARVFRIDPAARHHNPEFTMLEWYRPGFSLHALMDEIEALIATLGGPSQCTRVAYASLLADRLGVDVLQADAATIGRALAAAGIHAPEGSIESERGDRDFWLDLAMGLQIGPTLGHGQPCFVYGYPASQASLARLDPADPRVAERFELYWNGVELANGFHELADAVEQRRRFDEDLAWRRAHRRLLPPVDEHFLAALDAGLPDCSGVALGFDRLVMLLLGLSQLSEAMAFDAPRA